MQDSKIEYENAHDFLDKTNYTVFTAEKDLIDDHGCLDFNEEHMDYYAQYCICVHKGRIDSLPYQSLLLSIGCSTVLYSDAVYIVFKIDRADMHDDGVKSYYLTMMNEQSMPRNIKSKMKSLVNKFQQKITEVSDTQNQPHDHLRAYMGNNTMLTETFFRRKMYVDTRDLSVAPHIIYEGRWEPWVTEFIQTRLQSGDGFIDIGANCGFFAVLAAHIVGSDGAVLAIEPQKNLANLISKSLMINGFDNYSKIACTAVGETEGKGILHTHDSLSGSASMVSAFNDNEDDSVPINPLPEIIKQAGFDPSQKFNLIKMDIEGFEYNAWKGMREYLKDMGAHTMIMEYTPQRYRELDQDPNDFVTELEEFGYNISILNHDGSINKLTPKMLEGINESNSYTDFILEYDGK